LRGESGGGGDRLFRRLPSEKRGVGWLQRRTSICGAPPPHQRTTRLGETLLLLAV